jgi:hypothetical protein
MLVDDSQLARDASFGDAEGLGDPHTDSTLKVHFGDLFQLRVAEHVYCGAVPIG